MVNKALDKEQDKVYETISLEAVMKEGLPERFLLVTDGGINKKEVII